MDLNQTIENIILIPRRYREISTKSAVTLVTESGYALWANQITQDLIFDALKAFPEEISEWMHWSDNKRVNEGWYFYRSEESKYVVGYLGIKNSDTFFSDRNLACASFIKKEIDQISRIDS